jgi:DedD protein
VVNEPDGPVPPGAPPRIAPPATAELASYVVQAGVFASPANARTLQQRLAKAGIRAKVETRVQLGPYKDRREAEQALAKLKKLGVSAVMVPAR